jgi:hypothetical protein
VCVGGRVRKRGDGWSRGPEMELVTSQGVPLVSAARAGGRRGKTRDATPSRRGCTLHGAGRHGQQRGTGKKQSASLETPAQGGGSACRTCAHASVVKSLPPLCAERFPSTRTVCCCVPSTMATGTAGKEWPESVSEEERPCAPSIGNDTGPPGPCPGAAVACADGLAAAGRAVGRIPACRVTAHVTNAAGSSRQTAPGTTHRKPRWSDTKPVTPCV